MDKKLKQQIYETEATANLVEWLVGVALIIAAVIIAVSAIFFG